MLAMLFGCENRSGEDPIVSTVEGRTSSSADDSEQGAEADAGQAAGRTATPSGDFPEPSSIGISLPDAADRFPVILIVLDTLRADHLGCYGYSRPTSPRIDELARTATLYVNARSTAAWTLPSHASLFTGLYPFQHGAITFSEAFRKQHEKDLVQNVNRLSTEHVTLAEVFKKLGWMTAAVAANVAYLAPTYQLDQGFAHYDARAGNAREINQRVFDWLRQRGGRSSDPFFLFLNYTETHRPYYCKNRPDFLKKPVPFNSVENLDKAGEILMGTDDPVPEDLMRTITDQYDLAIRNLDEALGELFDGLKEKELWESSLIVVTSDHGELFGEHRLMEHSKDVYEAVLRVPLIVKDRDQTGGAREERDFSLVELPSLILFKCGLLEAARKGGAFLENWNELELLAENHFSRPKDLEQPWGKRFQRERFVIYEGAYKLIHSTDGQHELYDLLSDPSESGNLFASHPQIAARMQQRLLELHGAHARPIKLSSGASLTAEELKMLEAMGYSEGSESKK